MSIFVIPVQAQITSEFGYQLHPEKLLENTEGKLQIFVTSNNMMVPKQIENLKVVSSDNSIIQILGVEDSNDKFTKNILIKAVNPGITTIALAASGFSSKEISLEVFNNNNHPTQILMKTTPEVFPVDGPRHGYVALELATTGGLPTLASEDTTIHLYTPNNDVIALKNSEIVIASGNYYAITEFDIIGSGDAIIFAETEGMKKISSIVSVLEASKPLKLQLSVFPENYNSFSGNKGFAIIQLLDAENIPVLAEEDIPFKLEIENPDVAINTSHDFEEVIFDKNQLKIEKGEYSTFTTFTPRPNIGDFTDDSEQTYNMFISANNILTEGDQIKIIHDEIGALEGKGPSVTKVLPFLTTGKEEIIAVTYYETSIEVSRQTGGSSQGSTNRELVTVTVPVQANEEHEINFSSSESDTVNPINPIMKKGESGVIVYGKTGTIIPDDSVTFYITDNEGVKTALGNPIGPIKGDISLVVEPMLPMILAEKQFPVLGYLQEGNKGEETTTETTTEDGEDAEEDARSGVTPFIEDGVLTFSANNFVDVDSTAIKRNQPYSVINILSNEVGSSTLLYQMGGFDGSTDIETHTTDPAQIHLSFPKNILANSETLATVQLLDSVGNPVYAKKDIGIKLVSNNESILKIPQEVTIEEGQYFTTFDLETIEEGIVELALLSEDFSLSKYDINIVDISPVLTLDLLGTMNWNERIEGKLSVSIPEIQTSLSGFEVEWIVEGGELIKMDESTNNEGIATVNVMANDKDKVSISAKVLGNGLSESTISKTASILNMPIVEEVSDIESENSVNELSLDPIIMIIIIIPTSIAGMLFFLKRTDRLELITEKIPIADKLNLGDRIEEIKEKISDIKNR
ncbi:hypothetical protein [Nitrosopumilus sp.]|uniref:hypothetical protein n=1 Tax=Nitrosopumilus sp. TaxID=2024843 RepID=UPI00247C233B|nr:hypothetical protein [Nitrosopumilus sp.]MCV0430099.1 hypothetical protein [Nitrosopumilus sp.]